MSDTDMEGHSDMRSISLYLSIDSKFYDHNKNDIDATKSKMD